MARLERQVVTKLMAKILRPIIHLYDLDMFIAKRAGHSANLHLSPKYIILLILNSLSHTHIHSQIYCSTTKLRMHGVFSVEYFHNIKSRLFQTTTGRHAHTYYLSDDPVLKVIGCRDLFMGSDSLVHIIQ